MEEPVRFGRYVVVGEVGRGSAATVYRVRHEELERDAAVKVLRASVRECAAAHLREEARVLADLDHPHIVRLYDYVEEPDRTWLAEQWVDGEPLDVLLARHRRLTPEQALGVLTGALSGLAHAHEHDIVHRDVSSSNILADRAGTSMLLDFGLAAPMPTGSTDGTDPTGAAVLGTPAYLSPEAARGEPVGKPGDVYSAAALTVHLLTGLPVFSGTPWELARAHRDQQPRRVTEHGPRLERLLERSLAKDPGDRPPDAASFLAELEQAATERYGAAWRARASIAGLVAGASAAGAVGAAVGGSAPATVAGAGLPVTGIATAAVRTGRSTGTKIAIAATAAAAVVVTAVVAVAVVRDADPDGTSAASDLAGAAEGEESPDPPTRQELREQRKAELEATVPFGVYDRRDRGIRYTHRDGSTSREQGTSGTWTFDGNGCSAGACRGSIASDSGATYTYVWDGTTMTLKRPPLRNPKAACVDTVTGETLPIGESAASSVWTYRIPPVSAPAAADGNPPKRFVVEIEGAVEYQFFGTCKAGPSDYVGSDSTVVMTRRR